MSGETFLGLPAADLDRLPAVEAVILGAPEGVTYPRPGSTAGCVEAPAAIRRRSQRMARFRDHHDFDLDGPMLPADGPRVVRYPSIPAATYPEFPLAVPFAPAIARHVRELGIDVFHAHHPFLLGPAALRFARALDRPLVFTYHTRYEKYAHYVPLTRSLVEAAAVRLSTRFADGVDGDRRLASYAAGATARSNAGRSVDT